MPRTITVKATITMTERSKPTLRLFLSQRQKNKFLLMKGTQPPGLFKIVIL